MASKLLSVSCVQFGQSILNNNNLVKLTKVYFRQQRTLATSEKPQLVVLGAGWGGFRCARDVDKSKFDVTVVSPRNHFLFTPLLPSTTVGTLEFRCVQEPVRTIKDVKYIQASARDIDFQNKEVLCVNLYEHSENGVKQPRNEFKINYDKLVLAMGTKSNTFGVPGIVSEEESVGHNPSGTNRHNVFFLKQLEHARAIRNRIIECFERASSPFISDVERKRLLTFVVVGGGPTSIEFASELHDFLENDVSRWYSDLSGSYNVILIEAGKHLLGAFDEKLSNYVEKLFQKRNISLLTGETVKAVNENSVTTGSGKEVPFGVCVWSTGNTALEIVKDLQLPLSKDGRILVDDQLKVPSLLDVYALGDCAVSQTRPLAMLAQVANQQGKYLGKVFNKDLEKPFKYVFMGSMAQLGTWKAVADLNGPTVTGLAAFVAWRSAYWGYQVSVTNKILIPMYWFKSYWFGRDISKF
eukprot:GFUD01014061.1.p1 GENE.GFUD01014061.1~~GFUD01014061.1.p1  ORF type:complete len:468 (+),score=122.49 GFUD01014061.1:108-1511(+)